MGNKVEKKNRTWRRWGACGRANPGKRFNCVLPKLLHYTLYTKHKQTKPWIL